MASLRDLFALRRAQPAIQRLLETPGLELTYNARGALLHAFAEIAQQTRRPKVLLPAYHCPSAIAPALHAGLQPVFYRIRRDLSIDAEDLVAKADAATAAVLVIHYFGIAQDLAVLEPLRRLGLRVVEDCAHAFVSAAPLELSGDAASDYRIYSFWKTVPCGVGGGLLRAQSKGMCSVPLAPWSARARNFNRLLETAIEHDRASSLRAALHAYESGRARLRTSDPRPSALAPQELLRHGESYYPMEPEISSAAMPSHCRRIIATADLEAIVARRRANFERYLAHAAALQPLRPLVAALPRRACPWVFPVLVEKRGEIDHRLHAAGVPLHTFGIYLHSSLFKTSDEATIADALFLAERVLCLGVHQNLDTADVDRAAQTIVDLCAASGRP